VTVVHDVFAALGFERFTIKVNDRRVLNGVLASVGLADRSTTVLRAIDKLPRIGPSGVAAELAGAAAAEPHQIDAVLALATLSGSNQDVLAALPGLVGDDETGAAGIAALSELRAAVDAVGIPEGRVAIDVSIARGLDYYTGIVMETFLDDLPEIGSCCSGGRYDDLASLYTKERLPGVGGSLGVDRLLAAMEELGMVDGRATRAPVLVTRFDTDGGIDSLALAAELRRSGIGAEVYPEPRRLGGQLKYADRRGHLVAVIAGPDERESGTVQVKHLAGGDSRTVPRSELVAACRSLLGTA
jgi:histidyl-tRNA synthetase